MAQRVDFPQNVLQVIGEQYDHDVVEKLIQLAHTAYEYYSPSMSADANIAVDDIEYAAQLIAQEIADATDTNTINGALQLHQLCIQANNGGFHRIPPNVNRETLAEQARELVRVVDSTAAKRRSVRMKASALAQFIREREDADAFLTDIIDTRDEAMECAKDVRYIEHLLSEMCDIIPATY